MKVIVVSEVGFGEDRTNVYAYNKENYIKMVESQLRWGKKAGVIENESEVEEWIEDMKCYKGDGKLDDVTVVMSSYELCYSVCEVQ